MLSAIVLTPGRTGSHIILDNLCSHFKIPRLNNESNSEYGIMHSHNPYHDSLGKDCIAILSTRRNKLESILSAMIVPKTMEHRTYSNRPIDRFTVSREDLWNSYLFHTIFYQLIDKTKFKTVIEIEYESMLADPKYLFSKFGVDKDIKFYGKKSPYNYYQIIDNINEIKDWFIDFENTSITDEMIFSVASNVEADLQQVQTSNRTKV